MEKMEANAILYRFGFENSGSYRREKTEKLKQDQYNIVPMKIKREQCIWKISLIFLR